MLTVKNLTGVYGKDIIFKNINFCVKDNEIVSVFGKNGSGKTTLIRYLSTMILPKEENIILDGIKYNKRNLKYIRENISVLVDGELSLYLDLTVQQNINYCIQILRIKYEGLEDKIEYLIDRLNLSKYRYFKVSALSKGNKQKVSILIALIKGGSLLILDEPDNGLDVESIKVLVDLLNLEKKNRSILLITHDLELINSISDRIISISNENFIEEKRDEWVIKSRTI